MPVHTAIPGHIRIGAGVLYWAPLGTAEPATTATASKFGTTFTGWFEVGATEDGNTFSYQPQVADLIPEESYYPEKRATTAITAGVSFNLWYQSPDNWLLAFNGGSTSTTGTAGTAVTTFTPPVIGAEVNRMLLWQNDTDDERIIWRSVFNNATVAVPHKKAPNKQILPVDFGVLQPSSGQPFSRYTCDTVFGAVGTGA